MIPPLPCIFRLNTGWFEFKVREDYGVETEEEFLRMCLWTLDYMAVHLRHPHIPSDCRGVEVSADDGDNEGDEYEHPFCEHQEDYDRAVAKHAEFQDIRSSRDGQRAWDWIQRNPEGDLTRVVEIIPVPALPAGFRGVPTDPPVSGITFLGNAP